MTPGSNFDDRLHDWLEDGPTDAPPQVLDTVLAAVPSIPQRRAAWRSPWRVSPMAGLARVLAGAAVTVALGALALFVVLRPAPGGVGGQGSPSPAAVAPPTAVSSEAATGSSPAPGTAVAPCDPATLATRITLWEGAAGHRIAQVELTNTGSSPCTLQAVLVPQLVDGNRSILIAGTAPAAPDPTLTVAPGGILRTLVQDGNYCGPTPVAPVSLAFVLADGSRILATPLSPADVTVPPCLGAGSAATIDMHPWAP